MRARTVSAFRGRHVGLPDLLGDAALAMAFAVVSSTSRVGRPHTSR